MTDGTPGSTRVRLSITPAMQDRIAEIAEMMGLPENQVAVFALSMGLRFMDLTFVRPMSPGIVRAIDERADAEARAAVADVSAGSRRK